MRLIIINFKYLLGIFRFSILEIVPLELTPILNLPIGKSVARESKPGGTSTEQKMFVLIIFILFHF